MNQSPVVTLDRMVAPAGYLGGPGITSRRGVPAELLSGADGTVGAYQRPIAPSSNAVERPSQSALRRCADWIPTHVRISPRAAMSDGGPNQSPKQLTTQPLTDHQQAKSRSQ